MTNAAHVRNAVARFDQVDGVSDAERSAAFANIKKAAKHYGVELAENDWKQLGRKPNAGRTKATRKKSAAAGAAKRATRGKTTKKRAAKAKAGR